MGEGKRTKNTAIQIDVNELKWINDTYGELAGDDIIREVSSRLRRAIEDQPPYSDVKPYMARISGSSFLIVIEDISGFNIDNMMSRLIPNLKASVDGDYAINLSTIKISTLIGVVSFPDDAWDLHGLWNLLRECVSIAEVKSRKGSSGIHLYEKVEELDSAYGRIDHDKLKRAIDSSEVGVLFKPIISTADRRTVAAEVFPSLSYSSGTAISVNNIKMAAEESGLISVLNEYILEKACVVAAGWFRSGYRKIKIICPLSRRQIYEGSISDRIGRIIRDTGMDPSFIELQIAESELFSDNEVFNEKLRGLNDLGIKIVVSKFGSGKMSVLQLLTGSQVSGIKLDPSITSNAGVSSKADGLCESLVNVCGALKLNLLVEGIEGDHDFEYLKGLGFTIFQGPKLSKPLQPKDFEKYFKIVFDKNRSILRLDIEAARRR
jgi:diguanylate cyclase (GGDEF)-like protein